MRRGQFVCPSAGCCSGHFVLQSPQTTQGKARVSHRSLMMSRKKKWTSVTFMRHVYSLGFGISCPPHWAIERDTVVETLSAPSVWRYARERASHKAALNFEPSGNAIAYVILENSNFEISVQAGGSNVTWR